MTLTRTIRAKGYKVSLEDMAVVITVPAGVDVSAAETWARKHEQELRCELVSEMQAVAGVRGVFPDAKVRKVKGQDGAPISGQVLVRVRVEESA